jgi:hypothetical protein
MVLGIVNQLAQLPSSLGCGGYILGLRVLKEKLSWN